MQSPRHMEANLGSAKGNITFFNVKLIKLMFVLDWLFDAFNNAVPTVASHPLQPGLKSTLASSLV